MRTVVEHVSINEPESDSMKFNNSGMVLYRFARRQNHPVPLQVLLHGHDIGEKCTDFLMMMYGSYCIFPN